MNKPPKITKYTQDQIKSAVTYEPKTGNFYKNSSGKLLGSLSKRSKGTNYWRVGLLGTNVPAHRLAWFYMTGKWPEEVDHLNRNGMDNSWKNLRECNRSENVTNTRVRKDNLIGLTGICEHRAPGVYRVVAHRGKKKILDKVCYGIEEAIKRRQNAIEEYERKHYA